MIEPGGVLTLGPGDHPLAAGADISGGGTLVIDNASGTTTFPAGTSATMTSLIHKSGTLTGAGAVTVKNLDWRGGAQSGTGTTTVLSGGTVVLSGTKTLSRLLRLDRALDLTAVPGSLSVAAGGVLESSGLLAVPDGARLVPAGGLLRVRAGGTLKKTGAGSVTLPPVENLGLITGTGTIVAAVVNKGVVAPGVPPSRSRSRAPTRRARAVRCGSTL